MRRAVVCAFSLFLVVAALAPALAVEGMWQPHQLPEIAADLKAKGLTLDPSQLTDLTGHPMKAVISLGGCTASFVSPKGLVITNYHCAYGSIQYNSKAGADLEKTGFLANTMADEIPAAPGSRLWVTVEVDDVTKQVLDRRTKKLSGRARHEAIEAKEKSIVASCEQDEGHRCSVRSFHGGLQFYRIKQLEIRDVRLVYAPPGSIGLYGGDIDNWMWPRHSGDFAFYRAYVGPDGAPADHSTDNVPFRPEHFLRVSDQGVRDGDFVMVAGYPGRTNRYRLSTEVADAIAWSYPTRRELFAQQLDIIARETAEREDAAIKYNNTVAGLNNASKNYEGMLAGFSRSDIVERKQRQEAELEAWLESSSRRAPALDAVRQLPELIRQRQAQKHRRLYYDRMVGRGSLMSTARRLYRLAREKQKPDAERQAGYQERDLPRQKARVQRVDRRFDPHVDRALWRQNILNYATIPVSQHVADFDSWFGIRGNEVDLAKLDARLEEMYGATVLGDTAARMRFFDADAETLEKSDDPFIRLAVHLYPSDVAMENDDKEIDGQIDYARSQYMRALIDFRREQGRSVYADANSTLRITYGTVQGYSPKDALHYTPFTRLEGILEKDTGVAPFNSPEGLLQAIQQREPTRFRDAALGSVPVNFLTDLDSTGGNSGSPTLNHRGELVGLLFDGNWESIISDWDFLPRITRAIHVDMRYTLWVMDRVDNAQHLLLEMGLSAERHRGAAAAR